MLAGQLMGRALNVHIGGLGLPGVDDIEVVVFFDLPRAAPHLVGVKYQNRHTALIACVVAQNVHQPAPCGIKAAVRQPAQGVPRKDDIVAVHQQIVRPGGHRRSRHARRRGGVQRRTGGLFGIVNAAAALYLAVGAFKNSQQFLILLQRAAVGRGPAAARVGLVLLLRLPGGGGSTQPPLQPAGNMGAGGDLIPFDKIPGPVGAEH